MFEELNKAVEVLDGMTKITMLIDDRRLFMSVIATTVDYWLAAHEIPEEEQLEFYHDMAVAQELVHRTIGAATAEEAREHASHDN